MTYEGGFVNKSKRFLKTSIVYMLGIVLSKTITFFLLPIYTSNLSPNEFGYYDLILSILNFFVPISFFQIWDGMFRFAFDYKNDEGKYKIITNTYIVFIFGLGVYAGTLFIFNKLFILDYYIYILVFGVSFALNYMYSFIARVFIKNKLFVISGLLNTFISSIINVILIVKFNFGIESLFISQSIGLILQAIIIEHYIKSISKTNIRYIDFDIIKSMLQFSLPLCVATASYWMMSGFTKLNINQQLGSFDNGIYSIADKFSSLIVLGASVFQYAWSEFAYSISNELDKSSSYTNMIGILFKLIVLGSSVMLLIIKWVFPVLVDESYYNAIIIIPIILFGVVANSIAGYIGTIFSSEKKTNWIFWSTIIASISNVIFSIFLTKRYGLVGSSFSLALSFVILLMIRLFIMKIKLNVSIPYNLYSYVIFYFIMAILYFILDYKYMIWAIGISGIFVIYIFRDILKTIIFSSKK